MPRLRAAHLLLATSGRLGYALSVAAHGSLAVVLAVASSGSNASPRSPSGTVLARCSELPYLEAPTEPLRAEPISVESHFDPMICALEVPSATELPAACDWEPPTLDAPPAPGELSARPPFAGRPGSLQALARREARPHAAPASIPPPSPDVPAPTPTVSAPNELARSSAPPLPIPSEVEPIPTPSFPPVRLATRLPGRCSTAAIESLARKLRWTGALRAELVIDAQGLPRVKSIAWRLGQEDVRIAACVREELGKWRFAPAEEKGRAVACTLEVDLTL